MGMIRGWGFLSYEDLTFTRLSRDPGEDTIDIDVVVSTLPEYDGRDWENYDFNGATLSDDKEFWETLGLGNFTSLGDYMCCTEEAFDLGVCKELGKIIISDPSEEKVQTHATILPGNTTNEPLSKWRSSTSFAYTTPVVFVMANCGTSTPEVLIQGDLVWMSYTSLSSIPTKLVLAILHLGLVFWYRYKMAQNKPTRIQVEVWISGVLALAAFSAVVSLVYVSLEATLSREVLSLRVLSDFATKTTYVVSRCLYVAIALGLGVTKVRLSIFAQFAIVALGLAVLFSKETADVMGDISFARRDNNFGDDFNQNRHEFLKLQFKLNNLFIFWIPLALLWTMREMRTMQVEPQKLQRHKWLLCLYCFSWIVTTVMVGMYILMRYGPKSRGRHGSMISLVLGNTYDKNMVDEIYNFGYWITLLCMAILWKPSPEAPMYGYVLLSEDGDHPEGAGSGEDQKNTSSGNTNDVGVMELAEFSSPPSSPTFTIDVEEEEVHHDLSLKVETVEGP